MTAMEMHAAVLLDQRRHPRRGPQLRGETVRQSALQQLPDDPPALRRGQRRRTTRREAHAQCGFAASLARIAPSHDRTRRAPTVEACPLLHYLRDSRWWARATSDRMSTCTTYGAPSTPFAAGGDSRACLTVPISPKRFASAGPCASNLAPALRRRGSGTRRRTGDRRLLIAPRRVRRSASLADLPRHQSKRHCP